MAARESISTLEDHAGYWLRFVEPCVARFYTES